MKEVTKDQFFETINRLSLNGVDVHPSIRRAPWPYTFDWKGRYGSVYGVTQDYLPEGSSLTKTRYFLADN
ncbi:MAG: hypothetical protein VKK63_10335 [Synechococcus sp.]|nr:hypothetical protein [Synechococcus sp.]